MGLYNRFCKRFFAAVIIRLTAQSDSRAPIQSPLKKTRYPDAESSEVAPLLISCNPMTSQPFAAQVLSRVSMCPILLTPLTAAVRTLNVPNVSSSSRDLALAASCFLRTDFLPARFPCPFSDQTPSVFHSVPGVFFYPGSCRRSSDNSQYFGEKNNELFLKNELFFKDPEDVKSRSTRPPARYLRY